MPVRRVANFGRNVIGHFPSLKMGQMVPFESLLEQDYLYWLDYALEVERFEAQPLQMEYQHEGRTYRYTPDFQLVQAGRSVLVECKPDRLTDQAANQRKFKAAGDWCRQRDWEFRLVTDRQLRAGFGLQNIKLLTRYARHPVDPGLQSRIYLELSVARAPLTLGQLIDVVARTEPSPVMSSLLAMLFRHELAADLREAPLSKQTIIRLPETGRKGGR
jgi:hypothetical protein